MPIWLLFAWCCLQHVKEEGPAVARVASIVQMVVLLLLLLALLGVFR